MGKKLLVAFDDSKNAMRAVEFVANYFAPDSRVTLFNVIPDTAALCEMNSPELTPYFTSQQDSFCRLEEKKKALVVKAQKDATQILIAAGFEEKNLSVKSETRQSGVARDIIKETRSGYDVIVLGRRGVSGIKDFILGSVSQKVFNLAKDISVLVVN